jgi:hypothetical protein
MIAMQINESGGVPEIPPGADYENEFLGHEPEGSALSLSESMRENERLRFQLHEALRARDVARLELADKSDEAAICSLQLLRVQEELEESIKLLEDMAPLQDDLGECGISLAMAQKDLHSISIRLFLLSELVSRASLATSRSYTLLSRISYLG